MNLQEFTDSLFNDSDTSLNDTLQQFVDRLMLRIFEYPALMSNLTGSKVFHDKNIVELEFNLIPVDEIHKVKDLIGQREVKVVKFYKDDTKPKLGFQINVADLHEPRTGTPLNAKTEA